MKQAHKTTIAAVLRRANVGVPVAVVIALTKTVANAAVVLVAAVKVIVMAVNVAMPWRAAKVIAPPMNAQPTARNAALLSVRVNTNRRLKKAVAKHRARNAVLINRVGIVLSTNLAAKARVANAALINHVVNDRLVKADFAATNAAMNAVIAMHRVLLTNHVQRMVLRAMLRRRVANTANQVVNAVVSAAASVKKVIAAKAAGNVVLAAVGSAAKKARRRTNLFSATTVETTSFVRA